MNADNPLKELTVDQLEDIFTGKVKNWKDVGGRDAPITVYSRENSSGTYEFFKEHVLKGKDFVASAQTMPGTAAHVAGRRQGQERHRLRRCGLRRRRQALADQEGRRFAGHRSRPRKMSCRGTYPIWRYLYVYVNPALDKGEIAAYLNWIRSDDGQKIVKDVGYYPLPKNLRSN